MQRFRRKLGWLLPVALVAATVACGSTPPPPPVPPTTSVVTSTMPETTTTTASPTGQELPEVLRDSKVESADADSAFQSESTTTGQLTTTQAYNYLVTVIQNTDKMWSQYFHSLPGGQEPDFYYEIVTADKPVTSNCHNGPVTSTYNNAFFCSSDTKTISGVAYNGSVILPLDTFMKMWNGSVFTRQSKRTGDFGAAVITMHEMGHSYIWDLSAQFRLPLINQPGQPKDKRNELLADCFAGVGAHNAYQQSNLTGTDVEEGVAALEAIGDAAGSVSKDPHGTPAERSTALMLGYNSGKPGTCIASYWPGVSGG